MSAPSTGGASRDGYGSALLRLSRDPRVVVLESLQNLVISENYILREQFLWVLQSKIWS